MRKPLLLSLMLLVVLPALANENEAEIKATVENRYKEWIAAASGCSVSTIAVSGTTSVWFATVTTMPSSTASVSGSDMVKVEP